MVTIKIEIGFDKAPVRKKREPDIKKKVWLAAFTDSAVWLLDTALLLKLLYAVPLYPFGMLFITCVFLIYLVYLIIKTQLLIKKYGKEIYVDEFGHTGALLAAVSVILMFFFVVTSYI